MRTHGEANMDKRNSKEITVARCYPRELKLSILGAVLFFANNHMVSIALPLYICSIGGTAVQVGLIASIMGFVSMVSRPFIGFAFDLWGRRLPMLLGASLLLLATPLYLVTPTVFGIGFLRAIHGAGFALLTSGYLLLVSDLSTDENRKRFLGLAGAAMPLSIAVFPLLTEKLIDHKGFTPVFTFAMVASFFTTCCFMSVIPKKAQTVESSKMVSPSQPFTVSLKASISKLIGPWASSLYLGIVDIGTLSFLPLYGIEQGVPFSLFFLVFAANMVVFQLKVGRIIDRFHEKIVSVCGYLALGLSMVLLVFFPSTIGFVFSAYLYALGFGAVETSLNTLTVSIMDGENLGKGIGILQFCVSAGRTIGAIFLGVIVSMKGFRTMFLILGVIASLPAMLMACFSRNV